MKHPAAHPGLVLLLGWILLPGCLQPLPEEGDFGHDGGNLTCPPGQLACGGTCVPSDADNCGACGASCGRSDGCSGGACHKCLLLAADHFSEGPLAGPGEVVLDLVCPRMPQGRLLEVKFGGNANAHHPIGTCRPITKQCVRWQLEVLSGEWVTFGAEACNSEPNGSPFPFAQKVEHIPAPPDGTLRVQVRALGANAGTCPTKIRFSLGTSLEVDVREAVAGPRWP